MEVNRVVDVLVAMKGVETKTPGLVVNKMPLMPGHWGITHRASGKCIGYFSTREAAIRAANRAGRQSGSFRVTEEKFRAWPKEKRDELKGLILEEGGAFGKLPVDLTCPNCGFDFQWTLLPEGTPSNPNKLHKDRKGTKSG